MSHTNKWDPAFPIQMGAIYLKRDTGTLYRIIEADSERNFISLAPIGEWKGTSQEMSEEFSLFQQSKP